MLPKWCRVAFKWLKYTVIVGSRIQEERWCNAMDARSGSIAIACVYLPGDPLIGTVPLYALKQSECIRSMCEFSIMSQFDTKYACFMCATEFPGSDRISLGNTVATFN